MLIVVVTGNVVVGVEVGRITAVAVVITVGVVMWIHRRHVVRVRSMWCARRRRRHHRTIAVVVVAIGTRTDVVTRTGTDIDDHPRLVVITVPAEAHRLEVLEGGKAVELIVQFVVWHHRVQHRGIGAVSRDADRNPSDTTRAHFHVLVSVAVTVVRIQVDIEIATVCVISYILHIIVNGDRIGIVGQHGL